MIDPTMAGVWWAETSKEQRLQRAAPDQAEPYDLAVIGGGFCGLSIALHAAAKGLSVCMLEAGTVGCGASGRSGGIVVPQFPGRLRPREVEPILGKRRSQRLFEVVTNAAADLFDLIRTRQIRCDGEQKGWVQPAHSEQALAALRGVYEDWKALGANSTWLDAGAVKARLGASGYLGGAYNPTGGAVNPYALALGLARVAVAQGAHILEGAKVTAIESAGAIKSIRADAIRVRARKVVIATNGHTEGLHPGLERSVIPIRLFHTITRPLTPEELGSTMPTRTPFTDTRKSGGFGRFDAGNRVVSGGAVFVLADVEAYGRRHSRDRVGLIFPQLKGIGIEHYWEGWCALTREYLPSVQDLGKDVYAVLGFSTRGVALAPALGREMARFLAEEISADDLPVAVKPVDPIPYQRTKRLLGGFAFPVYQLKDRLGLT